MKLDPVTRKLILGKQHNHEYGKDGFCLHCKTVHAVDWKKNDLCSKKIKDNPVS